MPDSESSYSLKPQVFVKGVAQPIKVRGFATYRVVSPDANPAVRVSTDGELASVHSGTATVEVAFEGFSDQVTVIVK
jgi:hypothetical protein